MAHLNSKTWIAVATAVITVGLSGCNASGDEQAATPEDAIVAPAANATQDASAAGTANGAGDHEADRHDMGAGGDQANHQMMEDHHRMRMDHMRMEEEHKAQKGAAHPGAATTSHAPPQATPKPEQPPMQGMKHE